MFKLFNELIAIFDQIVWQKKCAERLNGRRLGQKYILQIKQGKCGLQQKQQKKGLL